MPMMTICIHCGKSYEQYTKCSCGGRKRKRNKATESETDKLMRTQRWKKLRIRIIKRDNGCCQRCLINDGTINEDKPTAHHIHSRKHYPELMWEESNLICVCMKCNNQLKKVKDGTLDFDYEMPKTQYYL